MSVAGVVSARALAESTLELAESLTAEEWAADSACHGWRVQDVIAHMGFFFNFIADPDLVFPDNPSGTSERLNDAAGRERADWTTSQVVDYYRAQSAAGLATLEALQGPEFTDATMPMLDLGTYRLAQLSDAVAFDHLIHLTCDLLAPHGPVRRADGAGIDVAGAIGPAVDWMIAGLPQMCGDAVHPVLEAPLALRLTGEQERVFVLDRAPNAAGGVVVEETADLRGGLDAAGGPDPAGGLDVATSTAADFLRWGTTRSAWRSAVQIEGDRGRVARVLDAIDIV